jgi:hypothetical protein
MMGYKWLLIKKFFRINVIFRLFPKVKRRYEERLRPHFEEILVTPYIRYLSMAMNNMANDIKWINESKATLALSENIDYIPITWDRSLVDDIKNKEG